MDCLQLRSPTAPGPFHYLINEHSKSLIVLQELQHEVGALLEFRDLVIETFPNLRTKLTSSTPSTMTSHVSNIPVAVRREWEPGIRVRRKLHHKDDSSSFSRSRSNSNSHNGSGSGVKQQPKSGDAVSVIQDSGFSTETSSSKETPSASSSALAASSTTPVTEQDESEDELWNLLDIIHRKGTRLRDEVEILQGILREQDMEHEPLDFQRSLLHASVDDVRQLRRERDLLIDRVAEMEAETLAGQIQTSRLQSDMETLLAAKQDLEDQLRTVITQKSELNSRIHDMHLQFVSNKSSPSSPEANKPFPTLATGNFTTTATITASDNYMKTTKALANVTDSYSTTATFLANTATFTKCDSPMKRAPTRRSSVRSPDVESLDTVLGTSVPRVQTPDSRSIAAILLEHNPIMLQKHLLSSTVQNQLLQQRLELIIRTKNSLADRLDKTKEENDDLRFQLEDRNIELEGTRARVRLLEQLNKPIDPSPDIIPIGLEPHDNSRPHSRSEITTASMKAMSPLPLNLQMDHSSSTESAHDQTEQNRRNDRRRPSKIPLPGTKSYAAPKPPVGKQTSSSGARSRSGGSPGRSVSVQSWRNRSEGNSLSGSKSNSSLTGSGVKSRNGRDSLTGKRNDSLSKHRDSSVTSYSSSSKHSTSSSSHAKAPSTPVRRSSSRGGRDSPDTKMFSSSINSSPWLPSSYNSDIDLCPDSLDTNHHPAQHTTSSSSHMFQTANMFFWNTSPTSEYFDSIDSASVNLNNCSMMDSSLYQVNGEGLAEYDSLEKQKLFSGGQEKT